jgi:ubiquinone/menaquinone biosynthesis C-methylase UbiE
MSSTQPPHEVDASKDSGQTQPPAEAGNPDAIKSLVQQQFGANAAGYASSKVHAQGASLKRLVELVQPAAHWQLLDVATAAGHTALVFAPHVAQVIASDITPEMLPVAARLAAEKGLTNVTVERADAEALPYGAAQFDLVTCRIAPHHFPHLDRFLAESYRVLRPGGLLAVVDNVVPGSDAADVGGEAARAAGDLVNAFEKLRDPSHFKALSVGEWLAALAQAGFVVEQWETALKEMEFEEWAARMQASPETRLELLRMLDEAPPAAQEFLQPTVRAGVRYFYLTEAIFVARKIR